MPVRTALDALTLRPAGFLRSSWPWRSALYLAGSLLLALPSIGVTVLMMLTGSKVPVFAAAIPAALAAGVCGPLIARFERWRLWLVDTQRLDPPPRRGLRGHLREQVTWWEICYALFSAAVLCWMDVVVVFCMTWFPVTFLLTAVLEPAYGTAETLLTMAAGAALLAAAPYPITAWAGARAAMTRVILGPHDSERLVEVTRSRARLVDAHEVERRRIERDLHDGAQQRLAALNLQLGLARHDLPEGSTLEAPLRKAHDLAKEALQELRELIQGIHPKVLTDRGLAAAVADVAGRSPVPVDVGIDLPGRLPEPIELAAYYVVVEALNNVAKHSAAERAAVTTTVAGDRIILRVKDDGVGGADPAGGTGLIGLADRVAAVEGTMALFSPVGGPTVLQVEFEGAPVRAR
ncbi:sensor histidine kinase [Actinoplanes solisilvae]|uniref:sensor histidine kinase n=1 Tax=Actinoplanes solisilvae TaxID=2486853 RepID=UPI000FD910B8|nr:histidine kinase [Actinoplanes solisilvae]